MEEGAKATSKGGGKRVLKRGLLGLLAVSFVGASSAGIYAYAQTSAYDASVQKVYDVPVPALSRSNDPTVVARGKHLVESVAGCGIHECHASDLAGGNVTDVGPIGNFVAPNITPGGVIAAYGDGELARLIRHGIKKDGRTARFMTSEEINWLPDSDLVAVISYVRSVAPVDRPNATMEIKPFGKVLDRRGLMHIDVARYIDHAHIDVAPAAAPTAEYGRYIAKLCLGCHGEHLSGGHIPGTPPSFPTPLNLTPHETGLKGWTYDDFDQLIKTGVRKNGQHLQALMPVEALSRMDDVEKHALWAYLQSLPPMPLGNR